MSRARGHLGRVRAALLGDPRLSLQSLETFYGTGVRLTECHRLVLRDLDLPRGRLTVREGKGGRPRVQPVGDHLAAIAILSVRRSRDPEYLQALTRFSL